MVELKTILHFQFCNFSERFSVYISCPSALTLGNLKFYYKTKAVKNTSIQEKFKLKPRLTFNPELALSDFRIR